MAKEIKLVQEMVTQVNKHLEEVDELILSMQSQPNNLRLIDDVQKKFQVIVSTVSFYEFDNIALLGEVASDLLNTILIEGVGLAVEHVSSLLSTIDAMRDMLLEVKKTAQEPAFIYGDLIHNASKMNEKISKLTKIDLTDDDQSLIEQKKEALKGASKKNGSLVKRKLAQKIEESIERSENFNQIIDDEISEDDMIEAMMSETMMSETMMSETAHDITFSDDEMIPKASERECIDQSVEEMSDNDILPAMMDESMLKDATLEPESSITNVLSDEKEQFSESVDPLENTDLLDNAGVSGLESQGIIDEAMSIGLDDDASDVIREDQDENLIKEDCKEIKSKAAQASQLIETMKQDLDSSDRAVSQQLVNEGVDDTLNEMNPEETFSGNIEDTFSNNLSEEMLFEEFEDDLTDQKLEESISEESMNEVLNAEELFLEEALIDKVQDPLNVRELEESFSEVLEIESKESIHEKSLPKEMKQAADDRSAEDELSEPLEGDELFFEETLIDKVEDPLDVRELEETFSEVLEVESKESLHEKALSEEMKEAADNRSAEESLSETLEDEESLLEEALTDEFDDTLDENLAEEEISEILENDELLSEAVLCEDTNEILDDRLPEALLAEDEILQKMIPEDIFTAVMKEALQGITQEEGGAKTPQEEMSSDIQPEDISLLNRESNSTKMSDFIKNKVILSEEKEAALIKELKNVLLKTIQSVVKDIFNKTYEEIFKTDITDMKIPLLMIDSSNITHKIISRSLKKEYDLELLNQGKLPDIILNKGALSDCRVVIIEPNELTYSFTEIVNYFKKTKVPIIIYSDTPEKYENLGVKVVSKSRRLKDKRISSRESIEGLKLAITEKLQS